MTGRITSEQWSAYNEHGVPYERLLRTEKRESEYLLSLYRDALDMWLLAYEEREDMQEREEMMIAARELTKRVLS